MEDTLIEFLDDLESRDFLSPAKKLAGEYYNGYMSAARSCWNYEHERGRRGFGCNFALLRSLAEFRGEKAVGACRFAEVLTGARLAQVMVEAHRLGKSIGFYESFGEFYVNE